MIPIDLLNDYLPENRIAIIANGQEELKPETVRVINGSKLVIAVDGGINLCHSQKIRVHYLIGDLDSINPSVITEGIQVIKLDRAKDMVDLEAGLQLASEIDATATPVIFNSLGGRLDHHINNLYLLLKYPQAVLYSYNSVIRAQNSSIASDVSVLPSISVAFTFYEAAQIEIRLEKCILEKGHFLRLPVEEPFKVTNGECILITQYEAESLDLSKILPLEGRSFPYTTDAEDIYLLDSKQTKLTLKTKPGLTISLLPWLGVVEGIKTTGLKWNLSGDTMSKNFVGISNIALEESTEISIERGQLLCIVEKNVIDEKMIDLVDRSSTAKFTYEGKSLK